jgi:hypothetical protein
MADSVDHSLEELDKKPSNSYATNRVMVTHEGTLDPSQLTRTEGYLWKKGGTVNARGGFRNWKKRWFVLTPVDFLGTQGYELRYYDGPNGSLKGHIGLSDVDLFSESKEHKSQKKGKHEFQILLQSGGVLELSADSEEEKNEWLETIGVIVTFLRKVTTSNVMTLDGYDPLCEDDEESFQLGEEIGQNCQAYGPGLFGAEAGKSTHFVVELHDRSGQKVSLGGMPVTASIENELSLYHLVVHDNEDGNYSVFYTLGRAGKYKLNVTLNEEHHVFGSPYEIEVLPSKTVPGLCIAQGEALTRGIVLPSSSTKRGGATALSSFTIIAMDNYGNRKLRGGDPFEIGLVGPAQLNSLTDNDDGSYTVVIEAGMGLGDNKNQSSSSSFTFQAIMILITLFGKPISGSPFKPPLMDGTGATNKSGERRTSTAVPVPVALSHPAAAEQPIKTKREQPLPTSTDNKPTPTTTRVPITGTPASLTANKQREREQPGVGGPLSVSTTDSRGPAQQTTRSSPHHNLSSGRGGGVSQPQATSVLAPFLPPPDKDIELLSPGSRLERSRQRALMAKQLADSGGERGNSVTMTMRNSGMNNNNNNNNNTMNGQPVRIERTESSATVPSTSSSHFGLPMNTLRNNSADYQQDNQQSQQQQQSGLFDYSNNANTMDKSSRIIKASKLSQLTQRNAASLQAMKGGGQPQPPVSRFHFVLMIMLFVVLIVSFFFFRKPVHRPLSCSCQF